MKSLANFILLCLTVGLSKASQKSYRNYKLIRARVPRVTFDKVVDKLTQEFQADFWWGSNALDVSEFMVSPHQYLPTLDFLRSAGVEVEILLDDVEDSLQRSRRSERRPAAMRRFKRSGKIRPRYETEYLSYNGIYSLLRRLERKYRDIVKLQSIGQSHEGREMPVVKLKPGPNKPVVVIISGIHAREWLSISTGLNIIHQLVEGYSSGDSTIQQLVNHFEFHYVPMMNPDGYMYSRFRDRIWRRNRKPNPICMGVDLNRNFDAFFQYVPKCSETYPGYNSFSEPETINLSQYMRQFAGRGALFLDIHCYGRLLLVPWAGTVRRPSNYRQLDRLARRTINKLQGVYNRTWVTGTVKETLGDLGKGSAMDWAMKTGLFNLSYAIELPPAHADLDAMNINPYLGFIRDTNEILPTAKEAFIGLLEMLKDIRENSY